MIPALRRRLRKNQAIHAFLRYNSPRKFLNFARAEFQRQLRCSILSTYPYKMIVDTTNFCNLSCIHCPTGRKTQGRKPGFMPFDFFKNLIDELGEYIYIIDLFNWGEPLLNRDIYDIIGYAEGHRVCTNIHSNFNVAFDRNAAEKMMEAGLSYLTVSLDGADQQVYERYRRNGEFEKVLENAKLLIDLKKERKSRKPFVTWQFLVFYHNRHQIESARRLARLAGFDAFQALRGVTAGLLADVDRGLDRDIGMLKDIEKKRCDWLWTTATFHWDGGIAPCCLQFMKEDDFGSVDEGSFQGTWNNQKFVQARRIFGYRKGNFRPAQNVLCDKCFKSRRGGKPL